MKLYGPNSIADSDPPQWIARTTARGFNAAPGAVAELAKLAPEGSRPFRAVIMRQRGRGAGYDCKVIFERIPQPGDRPVRDQGSDCSA